jgi:hypothetical protein
MSDQFELTGELIDDRKMGSLVRAMVGQFT